MTAMRVEPLAPNIPVEQFFAVDVRVGKVVDVKEFPEARKPAYQVWVDFGPEVGVRKTSAQITVHYTPENLMGRQVLGWVNAPVRQIGPFMSEFLLLGVHDAAGAVVLVGPEKDVG
ncbi:MAG: tRNA-binding protein, partial [Alphaproteobacteria bacterium]